MGQVSRTNTSQRFIEAFNEVLVDRSLIGKKFELKHVGLGMIPGELVAMRYNFEAEDGTKLELVSDAELFDPDYWDEYLPQQLCEQIPGVTTQEQVDRHLPGVTKLLNEVHNIDE